MSKRRRQPSFAVALAFTTFFSVGVNLWSQTVDVNESVPLSEHLVATVEKARSWRFFDAQFPDAATFEHWVQGFRLVTTVAVFNETSETNPSGRFWEILIWFENTGVDQDTILLHTGDADALDIRLFYGADRQEAAFSGFRFPGTNIAPISLIVGVEGDFGVRLNPGEKTWLLIVFDVPIEVNQADITVKNSDPVTISLGQP